jgi:hypothetical protein
MSKISVGEVTKFLSLADGGSQPENSVGRFGIKYGTTNREDSQAVRLLHNPSCGLQLCNPSSEQRFE